jgi:hypothetical protein
MLGRRLVSLAVAALLLNAGPALAAPKAKGKPAVTAKSKKGKATEKEKEKAGEKETEQGAKGSKESDEPAAAEDAKAKDKEESVKPAGTNAAKGTDAAPVKVKEDKEGVKTYKFETVEVEGRLRSPQVIYFLRRVRAEFDAGALGHRSFLGELSDSRRSAAFR